MVKRKKYKDVEMYCSCGHSVDDHRSKSPWDGWCGFDDGDLGKRCDCIEFRLDALLYLEEIDKLYHTGE